MITTQPDGLEALLVEISAMDHPGNTTEIDIARYLSGLMSEEENTRFENVMIDNPEFAIEVRSRKILHAEMFTPERMDAYDRSIRAAFGL